ncbi:MAG: SDR family oxidoreductase, partial [Prevotella sp.]|nr:SDR family oxidoreductase [Prevotella sp.]
MAETTFFITGATGLLGTEVIARLIETTDSTLHVLVRARNSAE